MKRFFTLLVFCILAFSMNAKGQFLQKLFGIEYAKGFAVLNNGDTIHGEIVYSGDDLNFTSLIIRDTIIKKDESYRPHEVKYYTYGGLNFYSKYFKGEWVFMCLMKDGDLKVYLYKYFVATATTSSVYKSYIYEKPNGQFLQLVWNVFAPFKRKTSKFFSDYPELSEKIKNGIYTRDDLYIIADEYNKWLKEKNKE